MILKLGMQHRGLEAYKVYTNDDPGLTLTYFTSRSNLVTVALLEGKVKTMNFSETIAACVLKVGTCRCRQVIEYNQLSSSVYKMFRRRKLLL